MSEPNWKLGRIGRIEKPIDKLKAKKEAFRKFVENKCKRGKR